jgi:hypothetical protein
MSIDNSGRYATSPKLYSICDAAKVFGSISPWTLRKHIARGAIEVTRIGRRVFLRSEEMERIRKAGLPSRGKMSRARANLFLQLFLAKL